MDSACTWFARGGLNGHQGGLLVVTVDSTFAHFRKSTARTRWLCNQVHVWPGGHNIRSGRLRGGFKWSPPEAAGPISVPRYSRLRSHRPTQSPLGTSFEFYSELGWQALVFLSTITLIIDGGVCRLWMQKNYSAPGMPTEPEGAEVRSQHVFWVSFLTSLSPCLSRDWIERQRPRHSEGVWLFVCPISAGFRASAAIFWSINARID